MRFPPTLNKITDVKESLPMTTGAVIHTSALPLTTLGTTVPGTTVSGAQEGGMTAVPPTLGTTVSGTTMSGAQEGGTTVAPLTPTFTTSTLSETDHSTATQTPSGPVYSAPSTGNAKAWRSPDTKAAHSTAFIPNSSGMTISSTMARTSEASPSHTWSSRPAAESCAVMSTQPAVYFACAVTATMPTQVNLREFMSV